MEEGRQGGEGSRGLHSRTMTTASPSNAWSPDSWQAKPNGQGIEYPDKPGLVAAVKQLSTLPPLVTSWEIPRLLLRGYQHAALTLNFVRSLVEGGFADLHHPEYWDLSFFQHASLAPALREEYQRMTTNLADGLRFMEALGERTVDDLTRAEF